MESIKEKSYIDKQLSLILKGIAIAMMIFHHVLGFPEWLAEGNVIIDYGPWYEISASFGKLCIGIFVFVSGYAFYVGHEKYKKYGYCLLKLFKFLYCYWYFIAFFFVMAIVLGEASPDLVTLLLNMIGLNTGTTFTAGEPVNSTFAWYVTMYCGFLILMPVTSRIVTKRFSVNCLIAAAFAAVGIIIHINSGATASELETPDYIFTYYPICMIGYAFAKNRVFERMRTKFKSLGKKPVQIAACVLLFAAVVGIAFARYALIEPMREGAMLTEVYMDIIITPLLIFFLVVLNKTFKLTPVKKTLAFLGRYSMNIWFFHAIFFTPGRTLQWVIYSPKIGVLCWILTLIITATAAWIFAKVQDGVWNFFAGLGKKKPQNEAI